MSTLSLEARSEILSARLTRAARNGWKIVARTETRAVLEKGRVRRVIEVDASGRVSES